MSCTVRPSTHKLLLLVASICIILGTVLLAKATQARTIAGGWYHSVGVKSDSTVVAWGANNFGQTTVPAGLSGVVAVAAGNWHSLALKSDGTVAAWGGNSYGESNVPAGLTGVVAVDTMGRSNLALKSDGTVVAWGDNGSGQLNVPAGLTGVLAVAAGSHHSLAVKSDGTVVAWGSNGAGQCNVPPGLGGVVAVAAGSYHSLALKSDGTVVAWGYDAYGQCDVPAGLSGGVDARAGQLHSLALTADSTVAAWGSDSEGQCKVDGMTGIVAVAAGFNHSLVLMADGTGLARGSNTYGQCNIPAGIQFKVPTANRPPLADAGGNVVIQSKDQAATVLRGTASDPEGDSLTYRWIEGPIELCSWQSVAPDGGALLDLGKIPPFSLGQHNLILEVSDSQAVTRAGMVLTMGNSAPEAVPSGAGTYQVNTQVTLGGQVSDYDGDAVSYQWLEGSTILSSGQVQAVPGGVPVSLPEYISSTLELGTHSFTLEVSDGINAPVSKTMVVVVADGTPPTLAPVADKTILWPPNRQMVEVTIWANASDSSGQPVSLSATVSCNEPNDGSVYWTEPVIDQTAAIITLQLQANSLEKGTGRQYTIAITAMDQSGNISSAQVVVSVVLNQRKKGRS